MLHAAGDWKGINEHIMLLSKRRAQLKQAISAMVKEAITYIDRAPNLEVKTELIETLNTVTSGKIFVEVEKARLTRALAKIKEEAGKIDEAASIMQEVAVETYGALSKHEKLFFIEEQVRLCLDKGDYIRAQILSRKINAKSFDEIVKAEKKAAIEAAKKAGEDVSQMDLDKDMTEEERAKEEKKKNASVEHAEGYFEATDPTIPPVPELKLRYYHLMIRFYSHSNEYLEICRCYQNIMECEGVKEDPSKVDSGDEEGGLVRGACRQRAHAAVPIASDLQGCEARGSAPAQAAHEAVHHEGDHPLGHPRRRLRQRDGGGGRHLRWR